MREKLIKQVTKLLNPELICFALNIKIIIKLFGMTIMILEVENKDF